MKSIVEEASSIFKAVEKAWHRAGSPQEFRVTVFEDAQKNFIGMTTRSAKIALFFNDAATPESTHAAKAYEEKRDAARAERIERVKNESVAREQPREVYQSKKPKPLPQPKQPLSEEVRQKKTMSWTPELTDAVTAYIQSCLKIITDKDISFIPEVKDSMFSLSLSSPVIEDATKEQAFYRSLSYLAMESLSHRFKYATRTLQFTLKNS